MRHKPMLKGSTNIETPAVQLSPTQPSFVAWRQHHRSVATESLVRLAKHPLANFITMLVLAIAITLPSSLNLVVRNLSHLLGPESNTLQMSLYLTNNVSPARAQTIVSQLRDWPEISQAVYISPSEAKQSFEQREGFAGLIDSLPNNPLPGLISLHISSRTLSNEDATQLKQKATLINGVDRVMMDLQWFQKISAIVSLFSQLATGLTVLLAVGVMLVIGNTIKLAIDSRREEIIVIKLIGATNAFIRRPFLYLGLWLGSGAALLAVGLSKISEYALTYAVQSVITAYGAEITLLTLGISDSLILLAVGAALGLTGAWLAADHRIRSLEPR